MKTLTRSGLILLAACFALTLFNTPPALCGTLDANPDDLEKIGLTAAFSILNRPMTLEEALINTPTLLEQTTFNLMRISLKKG